MLEPSGHRSPNHCSCSPRVSTEIISSKEQCKLILLWHNNNLFFGFLAHSSSNPWNLCSDECLLYANEVTGSWGSLDSFWKALAGGTNLVCRMLELVALPPNL